MSEAEYLTPKQVAARPGLAKTDTVLAWIRTGQLSALNVAADPAARPSYRIRAADLDRFMEGRAVTPAADKPSRPRRRERPSGFVAYF